MVPLEEDDASSVNHLCTLLLLPTMATTSATANLFHLVPFLSFLLLSKFAFPCPIEVFNCNSNSTNEERYCGSNKLKCENSSLKIQFNGQGPFYKAGNITFPEKKLKIWADDPRDKLSQKNCDFFYNFTSPIRGFNASAIPTLNSTATFFNCDDNSYSFMADVFWRYYHSSCSSYDLMFTYHPEKFSPPSGDNCTVNGSTSVEWELSFEEKGDNDVEFSLVSVGFSHRRRLSSECFSCQMSHGVCKPTTTYSNCSCNYRCPAAKRIVGKMVLIGLFAFLGFFLLFAGGFLWIKHRKKERAPSAETSLIRSISSEHSESISTHHIFTNKELEDATDVFSSSKELGDGGFGAVYKGILKDGRTVAVKRLYENNYKRLEQFLNEVSILNRLRHPNLVSLYGCTSRHSRELLLVYEYVPNGTVADHLHGHRAGERALTWPARMNIAIETADALAYLHAVEPPIIHRDVKTNNILLDNGYHVKVADFGLSRLFPLDATHVSTAPQGTPGYVDPEYHQCYQLTDKSDVYSFGVVLVELISSKSAVDITRHRQYINLSNMAINKIPKGLVHELADPELGYYSDPDVKRMMCAVAELAYSCLQSEKDMRPSMKEVKEMLIDIVTGDCKDKQCVDGEKQKKDDICLLISERSSTPDTVSLTWNDRITTPNSSS